MSLMDSGEMNVPEDEDEEEFHEQTEQELYHSNRGTLDTRAMSNDSVRPSKQIKAPRQPAGEQQGFCCSGKEKPCSIF